MDVGGDLRAQGLCRPFAAGAQFLRQLVITRRRGVDVLL